MASDETFTAAAGDEFDGDAAQFPFLEIQAAADDGDDADDEKSDKTSPCAADDEDGYGGEQGSPKGRGSDRAASLPGTPDHRWAARQASRDCASETELRSGCVRRRRRWARERKLDRAWEMRKSRIGDSDAFLAGGSSGEGGECLVVVRPRGGCGRKICMDMEEVRACCDLGLGIPRDFTVQIPGGLSGNSSGGDSPISVPGEDAKEMKEKLKMWAHAVAFVSAATTPPAERGTVELR